MKTLHKPSGAMNHFRQLFTLSMIILSGISSSRGRGNSYFQQEVNYSIEVELDDASHYLRGKESFLYKNNSQDTLNILYLHVWPNAYRDENTVLARIYENDADQRMSRALARGENGFIDSLEFTADGNRLSWQSLPDTPDVLKLLLISPLYPGASVEISTPLRIKIPSAGISRFGHDKQSYYITQWYPKPAVYDDGGWKYLPYVDKGEFYSEFGSFDVKITLPENYVVGATGELVDGEKETEWLNNKMLETMAIEEFRKEDLSYPPSSDKTKTLHFRQDRVHDFAWFADKRWHVLKSTMELPASRERVTIWAFFTNRQASWWLKAPEYMERTVYDYSRWLGDYPYKNVTAVEVGSAEGADMEYPMITAIGTASSQLALESVLAHEVGHNWFYGILGNDERRYPWLDEGMNSFFDKRYIFTNYAGDSTKMNEYFNRLGRWGKW
ncbi:MAG: M1 family metallopeptidase [Bacteroidota bacterium]